jgi:hypothetical protein
VTGLGLHIHRYQSPIEDNDYSQVRPTGRESLVSTLCRVHPENSYKDEQVGYKNYQKRDNQIKCCKNHNENSISLVLEQSKDIKGRQSQKKLLMTLLPQKGKVKIFTVISREINVQ